MGRGLHVHRRLHRKSSRKDFLCTLVDKVENGEVEKEEMSAHVSTLVSVDIHQPSSHVVANKVLLELRVVKLSPHFLGLSHITSRLTQTVMVNCKRRYEIAMDNTKRSMPPQHNSYHLCKL